MRMRVLFRHSAVRRPASVAEADSARVGLAPERRLEVGDAPSGFTRTDGAVRIQNSHTARVVAAIFHLPEAMEDDRERLFGAYVADNATHSSTYYNCLNHERSCFVPCHSTPELVNKG